MVDYMNSDQKKVMNLKRLIMQVAKSNPYVLPQMKLIEEQFSKLPLSRKPDHPTYFAMIWAAISESNSEVGLTIEEISKFIEENNDNLPVVHKIFLNHHLEKLLKKGSIVLTSKDTYKLPHENSISLGEQKQKSSGNGTTGQNGIPSESEEGENSSNLIVNLSKHSKFKGKRICKKQMEEANEAKARKINIKKTFDVVESEKQQLSIEIDMQEDIEVEEERNQRQIHEENGEINLENHKNQVGEELIRLGQKQDIVCHDIVELSKMVRCVTQNGAKDDEVSRSSRTHQKAEHLILSKDKCIELLNSVKNVHQQLIQIIGSFDKIEESNNKTTEAETEDIYTNTKTIISSAEEKTPIASYPVQNQEKEVYINGLHKVPVPSTDVSQDSTAQNGSIVDSKTESGSQKRGRGRPKRDNLENNGTPVTTTTVKTKKLKGSPPLEQRRYTRAALAATNELALVKHEAA